MKRQFRNIIVSAVALSMMIPAIAAPEAQAAAKPKLKGVSVQVGKTKKVTVKGVKAKKIKETTWSLKKKGKKIISLSKKKKNSVTVKGKKAGSAKLTAKIKVGKKTYKKTCTVKVQKATGEKATPTPSNDTKVTPTPPSGSTTATPTPSSDNTTATPTPGGLRKLDESYKTATAPKQVDPNTLPTTPPSPAVDPQRL